MPSILIADDNVGMRKSLRAALPQDSGWRVCGEATNGLQAVLMAGELKPDVIILDQAMPILGGIGAAVEILKTRPGVPIVLFTLHQNAQMEAEATKAGIRKVISKTEGIDRLLACLEELVGEAAPPAQTTGAAASAALAELPSKPPEVIAPDGVAAQAAAQAAVTPQMEQNQDAAQPQMGLSPRSEPPTS
jgi:DNA-binding NarL/FixJ family response regulator